MSNEEQNGFFANTLLAAVPIVSTHLEDKYGFECKVDYDKDFFGKMASLTVSGQLEAETFAMAYKKVYTSLA